jgi:hypothetical protein
VAKEGFTDFCLVIKLQAGDREHYLLEAYAALPTGSEQPLASAVLPRLNYERLGESLNKILNSDRPTPQSMGDYLFEWLFTEQSDTAPHPLTLSSPPPFNPVGAYLHERFVNLHHKQPLRLWICVDRVLSDNWLDFRGYLPFEYLEHNSLLPVRVIRGVVGSPEIAHRLVVPSSPLEVADKLRVLLVYANPDPGKDRAPSGSRYEHLKELSRHFEALRAALNPLVHAGELFIEVLRNRTPERLRDALIRFNPHVLVFADHGYGSGQGGLVCVRDGAPEEWAFPELVKAIRGTQEPALRLAVFIACRSFVAAGGLLATGVPAVEAMQPLGQADFPEPGVSAFAEPFFSTLAHFGPLMDAHVAACRALEASTVPYAALMPTLWLATAQDRLFASPEERLRAVYLDTLLGKPEVARLRFPGVEGGVNLDTVYVDQTVTKEEREKQPVPSSEAAVPELAMQTVAMQEVVRRVPVNFWEKLKEQHWVWIEAPAWTGKSTLCQWVTQRCFGQIGWLPIFVNFRGFAQSEKSIQRYLDEDYTEWLGFQGREIEVELPDGSRQRLSVGSWLFNLWQAGQALLILDGADEEFNKEYRDRALASLPAAQQRTTRPRVLLTSRPLGDGGVLGFEKLELNEFEQLQIESLVHRCGQVLGEQEKAERFIEEMSQSANGQALQLAARPGHLVHMFATYVQDGVLLTHEDDLMQRVAERRFAVTGRVTPKLEPDEPVYKRQVVEVVAFHTLSCRQGQAQDREQMLKLVSYALSGIRENGTPVYAPKDGVTMLEDLCRNSGFLRQTQKGTYEFESIPWLQFFAARHLARRFDEGDVNFQEWVFGGIGEKRFTCELCRRSLPPFNHYFWHPEWQEVIVLIAGLLDDATPLLQRLQAEPDDVFRQMFTLAACCLGSARKAEHKVASKITRAVCQEWRQAAGEKRPFDAVALGALSRGREKKGAEYVCTFLIETLKDKSVYVHEAAAWALGEIKDARELCLLCWRL